MTIATAPKSDNLKFMKDMTVTEVARNFSAVIDAVEAGEEILVRRGKVTVAKIQPARTHVPNGAALIEALKKIPTIEPPYDPVVGDVWDEVMAMRRDPINIPKELWEE
jgi:antitoxin (DNA-binding transcriptional repressor) of toxin-antitoxin stability system